MDIKFLVKKFLIIVIKLFFFFSFFFVNPLLSLKFDKLEWRKSIR